MISASQSARVIEFPCIPWKLDDGGIHPEKGSWTLTPQSLRELRPEIEALLCCPNCSAVMPFAKLPTDDIDRKHQTGVLTRRDLQCKCGLLFTAKLLDWDKRRLYCVAYETFRGLEIVPHKEYLHAETDVQARYFFEQGHVRERYNIVGIAPVVGYFADEKDRDAKRLMVD